AQKTSIANGDSNAWDLTTLTALLLSTDRPKTLNKTEIQQLNNEDKLLKQLRDIRNNLAHHPSKSIDNTEFDQLWIELVAILGVLGDMDSELNKLKHDSVFELSVQSINEENMKEAKRLNSLGTQAHKAGNFFDAIRLFTKATDLSNVSDHDRAVFYSNMSSSRLALYEPRSNLSNNFDTFESTDQRYRALQDAKEARNLWPTWWKGHFRVALDESRQIYERQSRYEHLDPRLQPGTIDEHLNEMKQKLGTDPDKVQLGHSLLEGIDPASANVVKGHKFEHGDIDVKQNYEQAAKYFAKAASQGNAEGMYNIGQLTDLGLGVKKDHRMARMWFEKAAAQLPQNSLFPDRPNLGVAEAEHALGLRYAAGVSVDKNLETAAYWYQRAVDHGSAPAANNLALMYLHGTGVDQDLEKAEQLLQLSARNGDQNAMLTLSGLLLSKNDPQMAKIWHDRACESGNIFAQMNRDMFEKLQKIQKLFGGFPLNVSQIVNGMKNTVESLKTVVTNLKQSNHIYIHDYNVLTEHDNRDSITAKRMCNALEHFAEALNMLMELKSLTEKQENILVHELSQCYRIEHFVAQFPNVETREKAVEIIDRVLRRCKLESNGVASQLDEDARICYAILHMLSHELVLQFLGPCKQKYPKCIHFFKLSAAMNGFLSQYEATIYDANAGLKIDPNYYELLYDKAVALRLLDKDMNEAIEAYRAFLTIAPKDHRKVPESYYAMANCYFELHQRDISTDIVKKVYEQGEEAEKVQLPCFLPYDSNNKTELKFMFDRKSPPNVNVVAPLLDRKSRLLDPHRIRVIKQHRQWQAALLEARNDSMYTFMSGSHEPRAQQQAVKSLIGLKPISLREIDPTKDHVYNGYVLSVTIIEDAYSWTPSIHLVIEDEHLDCERMFIYGFPEGHGKYLTSKVFTLGSKMSIMNPYLRLGGSDMKSSVRIDDFSSIIMQNESERVLNMCRCCGTSNALHVCGKCKQAHYCTKECQITDWKLYGHKLICKKQ
ncbi:unnamed protein product, partial [Rotaria sordida]